MNRGEVDSARMSTGMAYQSGFANEFASEAIAGTLPEGRNSPQRVAHGLYAEQLSGTAFTAPQLGRLKIATELGVLEIEPQEIAVIPRGVRFRIELLDPEARGYVAENFGALLRLPELGPIGSNGLANARDFLTPVAAYEDV